MKRDKLVSSVIIDGKTINIGDQLYIPGSYSISNGSSDVDGGLATIEALWQDGYLPKDHYNAVMVDFKGIDGHRYNIRPILERQEQLAKDYAGQVATPNPDIDRPWIEEGDIVNGKVYHGNPIW